MNIYAKVFFGYYLNEKNNKILLGISKNKSVVKTYLENHRGLHFNQYIIDSEIITEDDMLIKYDNYMITEYRDYYIPNIDQIIIDLHSSSIDMEIVNTINQLKHIAILTGGVKRISIEESETLIEAIRILTKFRKTPKILNKLNKQYSISHSLLYCDIEEYLKHIRDYRTMVEFNTEYKNALMKD